MAIEVERKFLVAGDEWRREVAAAANLAQGYVSNAENATVRVRISADEAWLTIKGRADGARRSEFEYEIPVQDARDIMASLAVAGVEKVRSTLRRKPHVWTVDEFDGSNSGLVLLEIESSADFELPDVPEWVGRDVTDDPRFANARLSERPISQWPAQELRELGITLPT
jgi:adenylate cyclase